MDQSVHTELLSLKQVVDKRYQFIIPSYQRPYVWSTNDIERLLNDIKLAYISNLDPKNSEPHYYIGTTLSSRRKDQKVLELIDGQQRTTTLILIALACHDFKKEIRHDILQVAIIDKKPRLHFEIREQVEAYFRTQAGLSEFGQLAQETLINDAFLKHIHEGLSCIKQQLRKIKEEREGFSDFSNFIDYIYDKVKWVNNIILTQTDLNKIFTSMNTAGVQLEPVDLVKSKILKKLSSHEEKLIYSDIWDVCQNMDVFFERSLRGKITEESWNKLDYKAIAAFDKNRQNFICSNQVEAQENKDIRAWSIDDIFNGLVDEILIPSIQEKTNVIEKDDEQDTSNFRSFLSFELLLIHALRIYKIKHQQSDIAQRITTANLQKIFDSFLEDAQESEVKKFIEILWQVRYQFDNHCVKWMEGDDGITKEELCLTYLSMNSNSNKNYYSRSKKDHSALELLQSVLIFTGNRSAQYWLTPFLIKLIDLAEYQTFESQTNYALKILEDIDNQLSLALDTQKEASYSFAQGVKIDTESWEDQSKYLKEAKGTSFEHYWFQKLEYVLWKAYSTRVDFKFKGYRITAKNSIEHVHPQNEKYGSKLDDDLLHSFGNLALLSPGQNSEYSNKAVTVKKAEFNKKSFYDSLKLKNLFDRISPNDDNLSHEMINQHQQDMIDLLKKHYT
ncbi:DUF262 domain-containing HNH endonuclease family protein [Acinetobacter guillouiae]|uniref:DUF262 domain-containing HNH endonuclease family protein n=1 Tax=Acinetobacter guillouiae TaxID=106649 RepID=A0A8X8GIL9_ACIGI|nr:DUF262 domain-containing protein [Acinetobacter guillouiae]MCF0263428.1 DUF262 domain-containing HNH endonuclease family protein [Acinetobacter guillouiae]